MPATFPATIQTHSTPFCFLSASPPRRPLPKSPGYTLFYFRRPSLSPPLHHLAKISKVFRRQCGSDFSIKRAGRKAAIRSYSWILDLILAAKKEEQSRGGVVQSSSSRPRVFTWSPFGVDGREGSRCVLGIIRGDVGSGWRNVDRGRWG